MGRRSTTRAGAQSAGEEWLELLFEFGLGSGDGGPWRRRFGERQDSPQKMVEDLLIAAAKHGLTDRVRRLLARGVDPRGGEIKHPIYQGRSPVQEAALNGHMDIVAMLVDAGATWEHDEVDELIATAMSGDRDRPCSGCSRSTRASASARSSGALTSWSAPPSRTAMTRSRC